LGTETQLQVIRESFGRVLYTHKTHEKDRERLATLGTISKWINIGLSGVTFGGIVATVGTKDTLWLVVSLILSTLSVGFAIFQMSFDPLKKAAGHRAAAKQLLEIRNKYLYLMADIVDGSSAVGEIRDRRDQLEKEAVDAYAVAPDTSPKAYKKAQTALQVQEDMTFSDDELNRFLPASLRYTVPEPAADPQT
jgi:hypothetical protein